MKLDAVEVLLDLWTKPIAIEDAPLNDTAASATVAAATISSVSDEDNRHPPAAMPAWPFAHDSHVFPDAIAMAVSAATEGALECLRALVDRTPHSLWTDAARARVFHATLHDATPRRAANVHGFFVERFANDRHVTAAIETDQPHRTALVVAALHASPRNVEYVLRLGADPTSAVNAEALSLACRSDSYRCAQLLLDARADPSVHAPLAQAAAACTTPDVARLLLRHGAAVNALSPACDEEDDMDFFVPAYMSTSHGRPRQSMMTALCQAVRHGDVPIARILLDHPDIDVHLGEVVNDGLGPAWRASPLAWACFYGYARMVRMLLEHGADVAVGDSNGDALRTAISSRSIETCLILCDHGAIVTEDVLVRCARHAHCSVLRALVARLPDDARRRTCARVLRRVCRVHDEDSTSDVEDEDDEDDDGAPLDRSERHRACCAAAADVLDVLFEGGATDADAPRLHECSCCSLAMACLRHRADVSRGELCALLRTQGHDVDCAAVVDAILTRQPDLLTERVGGPLRAACEHATHTTIDALLHHYRRAGTLARAVRTRDERRRTPLVVLVTENTVMDDDDECTAVVHSLLDAGAEPCAYDAAGRGALSHACSRGRESVASALLERMRPDDAALEVLRRERDGRCVLQHAISAQCAVVVDEIMHLPRVGGLLDDWHRPKRRRPTSRRNAALRVVPAPAILWRPLLHQCVDSAWTEGVDALLLARASPDVTDPATGMTPLMCACVQSTPMEAAMSEIVDLLLHAMAEQRQWRRCSNENEATHRPRAPTAARARVDAAPGECGIDARDDGGRTALYYACAAGKDRIARRLVAAGANATQCAPDGGTPVMQMLATGGASRSGR